MELRYGPDRIEGELEREALRPDGAIFLDITARVKIEQRPYDVRWITTARTDQSLYQQLTDINKFKSLPGMISIEDPDTANAIVVHGRTMGLGMRRNLNFTAHTRFLSEMAAGAELPGDVYLDIILGEPYLNPNPGAVFHASLVMPLEALELRNLGIQLQQAEDAGRKAPDRFGYNANTLDTLHMRIAEVRGIAIPMAMRTTAIHAGIRRRLLAMAGEPVWKPQQSAAPGAG